MARFWFSNDVRRGPELKRPWTSLGPGLLRQGRLLPRQGPLKPVYYNVLWFAGLPPNSKGLIACMNQQSQLRTVSSKMLGTPDMLVLEVCVYHTCYTKSKGVICIDPWSMSCPSTKAAVCTSRSRRSYDWQSVLMLSQAS